MIIGRTYTVPFTSVAVTAQQDFFEIVSGSAAATAVLELHLSQSTEVGDAMEEGLSVLMKSGSTTTGSGGSTVTPVPLSILLSAYTGTTKANNTTKATAGTIVTHKAWNWNVRVPFDYYFPPDARKIIAPGARLTVELATTPADSITVSGYMVISEIG